MIARHTLCIVMFGKEKQNWVVRSNVLYRLAALIWRDVRVHYNLPMDKCVDTNIQQ